MIPEKRLKQIFQLVDESVPDIKTRSKMKKKILEILDYSNFKERARLNRLALKERDELYKKISACNIQDDQDDPTIIKQR